MTGRCIIKFWLGSLDRDGCKARGAAAGLALIMEDAQYLYYEVQAEGVREAENLVYAAVEPHAGETL